MRMRMRISEKGGAALEEDKASEVLRRSRRISRRKAKRGRTGSGL